MTDYVENKIYSDKYSLFDKCMYGGLGHGIIIFPKHLVKIIFSVIFPPIGVLINIVENSLLKSYPFITWDVIIKIFTNLNRIIYSYILTSLFYIPGLVYTLSHHSIGSNNGKILGGTTNAEASILVDSRTGQRIRK